MGKLEKTIEAATGKPMVEVGNIGSLELRTDGQTKAIRRVEAVKAADVGVVAAVVRQAELDPAEVELVRAAEVIVAFVAENDLAADGPTTYTSIINDNLSCLCQN